jgi:hypothetical protein
MCYNACSTRRREVFEASPNPFARLLLALAVRLYQIYPRIVRLDAGYWGLQLIHWIHASLGAVAVDPWKRHPPEEPLLLASHWTKKALGKRTSIERFFCRVFLFFRLQRPPFTG